ncbi:MAG TPA: hypothetical protein VK025_14495 [Steroidobacter sp.]|nr:hypothetical protein [Steroidobacteraceae bacterium]HLS82606.1 hypothetical protein [Steroidobacter sp.]
MSAGAGTIPPGRQRIVARAEHISIEGDSEADGQASVRRHRITKSSYVLQSRLRGCVTELSILEGCYLGVRSVRPGADPVKYQFDLRFANPQPVTVRSIAWMWLVVTIGLIVMGAGAIAAAWTSGAPWVSKGVIGGGVALCVAALTLLLFLRGTTEALEFRSAHGDATLVSVAGGLGAAREGKQFFIELIKSINAAKLERAQPQPQFLRDEMREHHRLRELGVLTQRQYEASKARILAAH